jgi:hypothetical protein
LADSSLRWNDGTFGLKRKSGAANVILSEAKDPRRPRRFFQNKISPSFRRKPESHHILPNMLATLFYL